MKQVAERTIELVRAYDQLKCAEEELRKRSDRVQKHRDVLLELANSDKSDLEFRTPLGIIQSSAEILEDYFEQLDPAERKSHLQSICKNTRRMAGLMEEALLIGSLDGGSGFGVRSSGVGAC